MDERQADKQRDIECDNGVPLFARVAERCMRMMMMSSTIVTSSSGATNSAVNSLAVAPPTEHGNTGGYIFITSQDNHNRWCKCVAPRPFCFISPRPNTHTHIQSSLLLVYIKIIIATFGGVKQTPKEGCRAPTTFSVHLLNNLFT